MKENDTIATILNNLVTINKDHIVGNKEAIHGTNNENIRHVLKRMVKQVGNFIFELKEKINELGAEVTDKTITTGLVYNIWMDIVFNNTAEKPEIRNFCDQIEDTTLQAYDSALKKLKGLDKNIFDLVLRQKKELVQCYNELKKVLGN